MNAALSRFGHTPLDDAYETNHHSTYELLKPYYSPDDYKHHVPKPREQLDLYPPNPSQKPRKVMFAEALTDSGIEQDDLPSPVGVVAAD